MYKHPFNLNNKIAPEVLNNLALFITHTDLNEDLEFLKLNSLFKNFTSSAFSVPREQRPSVSLLADIFRETNCPLPSSLACEYAKDLERMEQNIEMQTLKSVFDEQVIML